MKPLLITLFPDHPGANDLCIRAVEAGPNPELGLPWVDRLCRVGAMAGRSSDSKRRYRC